MTIADRIEIESDEKGFELHVWVDEEPEVHENGLMILNIQNIDLDAFYDQIKSRLGPYLREMNEARTAVAAGVSLEEFKNEPEIGFVRPAPNPANKFGLFREVFECDPDESGGYDISDPKHPAFHSTHADIWDNREGK